MRLSKDEVIELLGFFTTMFGSRKRKTAVIDAVAEVAEAYSGVQDIRRRLSTAAAAQGPLMMSALDVRALDAALAPLDRFVARLHAGDV